VHNPMKFFAAMLALGLLGACAGTTGSGGTGSSLDKPEISRSLLDAAAMAAAQGDLATASGYYRNVYLREPGNARAAVGLMQTLREQGDLEQARQIADAALLAKPNDATVVAEVGKVRLASGQLPNAVALLQRAVELDAADWKSRSALGVAYDRLGESAKAEETYRAALEISPNNPVVLNNLALSRVLANDLPGARDLLQRAVATSRSDVRVRQNLALLYALSGNMAQAEALTLQDLPPELARATLAYYRELATQAQQAR
jgi:Flp pilus assembly protein TadD